MSRQRENTGSLEKLLGVPKLAPATGGHKVDMAKIQAPFKDPTTVVRNFCTGCGCYLELMQETAEGALSRSGVKKPDSFEGKYLQSKSCPHCTGGLLTEVTLHSFLT